MRVLLSVHHHLDWNAGAPGSAMSIAAALSDLGHETLLHSFDDLPTSWSERRKMIAYPWAFASFALRHARNFDVVDASTGDAWVWSLLRHRDASPPLVVRSHGIEHLADAALTRAVEGVRGQLSRGYHAYHGGWRLHEVEITLRRSNAAFFLNEVERRYSIERFDLNPSSSFLIHNGLLDELLDQPAPQSRIGEPTRIAQIGTYVERKGITWGAAALDSLLTDYRDVSVNFLGTKHPREVVLADFRPEQHDRIGVVESFERCDLPRLLKGHQIVLLPTLSEGFPTALLEGMACGLAPVSTSVGGPSEFVVGGKNGLLVSPGDVNALRRALESLVMDRALLMRLRTKAHATAQAYSWSENATRRLHVYDGLLQAGGSRSRHRSATRSEVADELTGS